MKAYVCSKCKKVFLTNIVTVTIDSAKNKRGRIAWGRDCVCEECQNYPRKAVSDMARYTKKDGDGRYYIESASGKLENDIHGRTYGEAINRLAEFENADVVPKSEVFLASSDAMKMLIECHGYALTHDADIKKEVAQEIFAEIEKHDCKPIPEVETIYVLTKRQFAELKKKYVKEGED